MTQIKQDLLKPIHVVDARDDPDAQASTAYDITVDVVKGGEPVALSGTAVANIVLPSGETDHATGTVSGNRVSCTVPATAFGQAGRVLVVLKLESGSDVTTIGAVAITVKGVS